MEGTAERPERTMSDEDYARYQEWKAQEEKSAQPSADDGPDKTPEPEPEEKETPRDRLGVRPADNRQIRTEGVQGIRQEKPKLPHEQDDAPKGSTSESLLEYDGAGKPVRVAGPTHYHHLADGRVVGGYGVATHYTEPGKNEGDPDIVTPIVSTFAG